MMMKLQPAIRLIRRILPFKEFEHFIFFVGAQKAGTTSLNSYLMSHPMVAGCDRRDPGFFDREKNYSNGLAYYHSMFPALTASTHALDATPGYLYSQIAAERIHAFRSDAKIVIVLREPVSRAFSAFNMYQQICQKKWFRREIQNFNASSRAFFLPLAEGRAKPDIHYFLDREMAIIDGGAKDDEPSLIRRGIYAPQLDRFIRFFSRGNVLVLFSDDLKREPERITNEVFRFVGLDALTTGQYPHKHVRDYTADNFGKEAIRECAGKLFEEDKAELINRYGLNVPW